MRTVGILAWFGTVAAWAALPAVAQVKTDGTLGARQTLPGLNVTVPHTLGQTRGGNLFHSFDEFNVPAGGSVRFTGPGAIHNVLARVTGSGMSRIDGTLGCDIAGANLYLINPAGVVFGAGGTIDVQGSFAVTTADRIHFADGGRFTAGALHADSVLTAAAPAAFGFLSAKPKSITTEGAQLAVPTGRVLAFVGGDVAIHGGTLDAPDGRLVVTAVASPGNVSADVANADAPVQLDQFSSHGSVTIDGNAQITTAGGGTVIRGGDVNIVARLRDDNASNHAGRGIDVGATGDVTISGTIISFTTGDAAASPISITGRNVTFSGGQLQASSADAATGAMGAITVDAQRLVLTANSMIFASARGSGAPADISLVGRESIRIDENSAVSTDASFVAGGERTGDVRVRTDGTFAMIGSAQLSTSSFGSVRAGNVRIDAANVTLDGQGTAAAAGIVSSSYGTGPGGNVTVHTGSMTLKGGGNVSALNNGAAVGGSIDVIVAGDLAIDGTGQDGAARTGLFADAQPGTPGNAGSIRATADRVMLRNSGEISASAFGLGRGGDITVTARVLSVEGAKNATDPSIAPTGILSVSLPDPFSGDLRAGAAGNIDVHASQLLTLNSANATISSDAFGLGAAGTVTVRAGRLSLNRGATIESVSLGVIGGTGDAGHVTVHATDVSLDDGLIAAITTGAGKGGTVTIDADRVTLRGEAAVSSSAGVPDGFDPNTTLLPDVFGAGGDVVITARQAITLDGASNIAAATLTKGQPSAGGRGGNVKLSTKDLSITGSSRVSVETDNAAAGGSIDARATGRVTVTGSGSGFDATTSHPTARAKGGDIVLRAGDLLVADRGEITASTTGAGDAGSVHVFADKLTLDSGARIQSASSGSGKASDVTVEVRGDAMIRGDARLTVASAQTAGGDLGLSANAIRVVGATVSAEAHTDGGNIKLTAPTLVFFDHATVTAQSGGDGGRISIDPVLVVMQKSVINGQSGGKPVDVTIDAQQFIKSADSDIQTRSLSIPPETDVAGALMSLPASTFGGGLTLKESCTRVVGGRGAFSSFLIVGRNAAPPAPGGWAPSIAPDRAGVRDEGPATAARP